MMKITPSNTSTIITLMAIYIAVRFLMLIFPFPMVVGTSGSSAWHYNVSYFTFGIHIALEALYCVLYLYIISLLKHIGAKKFVLVAFYIHIVLEIIYFGFEMLNLFSHQPFEYYSYLSIISWASILYTVIVVFWIKYPVLSVLFRIYGFFLVFIVIIEQLYLRLIVPHTFTSSPPFYRHTIYEYILDILAYGPMLTLLYILIKSKKVIIDEKPVYMRPVIYE